MVFQEITTKVAIGIFSQIKVFENTGLSTYYKDFFNKPGSNCDDVSKNGYHRPS